MKDHGNLFMIIAIPVVLLLMTLFIRRVKEYSPSKTDLIEVKRLHTQANEHKRKPYVIKYYDNMVCGERIERTKRGMAYLESYCTGSLFQGVWPPDSLKKDIHHKIEAEVDSIAYQKF